MTRLLLVLLTTLVAVVQSEPDPTVRIELEPSGEAWVGQRVQVTVTLLTPDLFAGAPAFDLPPVSGAVLMRPTRPPTVGTERVDGASFTTQRHELALYAERAGTVEIPAFHVRFRSNAGYGKPTHSRDVITKPVSLTVKPPPGSEGLGRVVAARRLELSQSWNPEPSQAKVGDAFTRTLKLTAHDVPGMILPPFPRDAIPGVSSYPRPPEINDNSQQGNLIGERIETITYVCRAPGTIDFPELRLTWYDLETHSLKQASIPGANVTVEEVGPASIDEARNAAHATRSISARTLRGWLARGGLLLASLALVGWLVGRGWHFWERWYGSEAGAFVRLRMACQGHDPHAAYRALLEWLDQAGIATLNDLAQAAGVPRLATEIDALSRLVYTRRKIDPGEAWSGRSLFACVSRARKRLKPSARGQARVIGLPPLNPAGSTHPR